MGYWGYEATESDSALDYMFKVIAHLETLWDEAEDYGERMAVVYVLTEAPAVDSTDYRGLKAKAVAWVSDCITLTDTEAIDQEDSNTKQEQITYLQGLVEKLQVKQGTSLIEKLTDCFELTNHEKRSIERFPKTRGELAEIDKSTSL